MPTVAEALRQHAPAYLKKFGKAVPIGHRKVISAIVRCRTGELGGVAYRCDDCGRAHWYGRSCGNRHCPGCGAEKTTAWLAKQTRRLMPVHHFLITCTMPDRIGAVLRAHQREGYNALCDAGAATNRSKTRRVTGEEFVRGFSQHVLPRGLQKVRHYGWGRTAAPDWTR